MGTTAYRERTCESATVAVSTSRPDAGLEVFAESRPGGAVAGAGIGMGAGAAAGLYMSAASGPLFPVVAPIFIGGGAVLGTVGGAIWGGVTATPEETSAALRTALESALAGQRPEKRLAAAIRDAGAAASGCRIPPETGTSAPVRPGSRIDVTVERGVLEGGASLALVIDATLRFPEPGNISPAPTERVAYRGNPYPIASWLASDGAFLHRELDLGMSALAEQVVDRFLLARELPLFPGRIVGYPPAYCGLKPLSPAAEYRLDVLGGVRKGVGTWGAYRLFDASVDSLRPELRWEAFPGAARASDMAAFAVRIREIVYDLDVWRANDGRREELVYRRRGLPEPSHQVETPLEPGTAYFWSVRSRFLLDGRLRATLWSCSRHPYVKSDPCEATAIPAENFLRFRTPAAPPAMMLPPYKNREARSSPGPGGGS